MVYGRPLLRLPYWEMLTGLSNEKLRESSIV